MKKKNSKMPRAFFRVKMGTQVITPKKGKGAIDLSPYSRKAKHKKTADSDNRFGGFLYLTDYRSKTAQY